MAVTINWLYSGSGGQTPAAASSISSTIPVGIDISIEGIDPCGLPDTLLGSPHGGTGTGTNEAPEPYVTIGVDPSLITTVTSIPDGYYFEIRWNAFSDSGLSTPAIHPIGGAAKLGVCYIRPTNWTDPGACISSISANLLNQTLNDLFVQTFAMDPNATEYHQVRAQLVQFSGYPGSAAIQSTLDPITPSITPSDTNSITTFSSEPASSASYGAPTAPSSSDGSQPDGAITNLQVTRDVQAGRPGVLIEWTHDLLGSPEDPNHETLSYAIMIRGSDYTEPSSGYPSG